MLRGRDIRDHPELIWCPEGSSLDLVNGEHQLVDTDERIALWGVQLEDRIHALEFDPSEHHMPVCADALDWVRKDIKLVKDIRYRLLPAMWILQPVRG